MKMKQLTLGFLIMLAVTGCATTGGRTMAPQQADATPWTNLDFNNAPETFRFAVVSDRNGGNRPGVFPDAVAKLNLVQPEFVMCVGDLIGGYTITTEKLDAQWQEVDNELAALEMPFFRVPGNHDITNFVMLEEWQKRYGQPYYHFVYKNCLFLCLDSEDPPRAHDHSYLGPEQLAYFQKVLAKYTDVRWTFLFLHKPMWHRFDDGEQNNWNHMETLLGDRPYTVFAGHEHEYEKTIRNGHEYYVLGTTGGGINLTGPEMGHFDHVTWVAMRDDSPRIVNLALDGFVPNDIVTYEERKMLSEIEGGVSAQMMPTFFKKAKESRVSGAVQVTNKSSYPVNAKVVLNCSGPMQPTPAVIAIDLAAGSSQIVPVEFASPTAISIDETGKTEGQLVVSFVLPGDDRERRYALPIGFGFSQASPCPTVRGITVDGDLSDWATLPFASPEKPWIAGPMSDWDGPEDARFRFGVGYDRDYLYLAVAVDDDAVLTYPDLMPWQQDAIEVRLDARPSDVRSISRGQGELADFLLFAVVPGQTEKELFAADKLPEGAKVASTTTETGYAVEIAVPVSYLNTASGGRWTGFRLNVAADDYDGKDSRGGQIWWQPDWRSPQDIAGSGTFSRAGK